MMIIEAAGDVLLLLSYCVILGSGTAYIHVQPINILPHSIASKPLGSIFLRRLIGIREFGSTVCACVPFGYPERVLAAGITEPQASLHAELPPPNPPFPFPSLPSLLTVNEPEPRRYSYTYAFPFISAVPFLPPGAVGCASQKSLLESVAQGK